MDWLNLLNSSNLILKILKQFIRCSLNPALGHQAGLRMKTNCTTYLIDNAQLIWKSAKRTEQAKELNQKDLILKILNPFIRCHQQIPGQARKRLLTAWSLGGLGESFWAKAEMRAESQGEDDQRVG